MRAEDIIKKELEKVFAPDEIQAGVIWQGYGYVGAWDGSGWWFQPFGANPMYLGATLNEALDEIEDWATDSVRQASEEY